MIKSLYNLFIASCVPVIKLYQFINPKVRRWYEVRQENINPLKKWRNNHHQEIIWGHCASLGEFELGAPLFKKIKEEHPDLQLVISFFSLSGYEHAVGDIIDYRFYLPIDSKKNMEEVLTILRPTFTLLIKSEFWPNLIWAHQRNNIPIFSIGFHLNNPRRYPKWFFKSVFLGISKFWVQYPSDQKLLKTYSCNNIEISGNPRLNRCIENVHTPYENHAMNTVKGKIIIYGSVYPSDWPYISKFIHDFRDYAHILVPHDLSIRSIEFFRNSIDLPEHAILIREMGILKYLYRYADLIYIGGGFGKGIHNILEPAVYLLPTIFGPNYERFQEARDFLSQEVSMCIQTKEDFSYAVEALEEREVIIKNILRDYFTNQSVDIDAIYKQLWKHLK